jgi:hypothetical protein
VSAVPVLRRLQNSRGIFGTLHNNLWCEQCVGCDPARYIVLAMSFDIAKLEDHIERLRVGDTLTENEVKALCEKVRLTILMLVFKYRSIAVINGATELCGGSDFYMLFLVTLIARCIYPSQVNRVIRLSSCLSKC